MSASTTKTASGYSTVKDHRTFFGHPAGLFILFFTEMWERFSYYGMRALLVLYMVKYLLVHVQAGTHVVGFDFINGLWKFEGNQPLSSHIYGLYTSLVYLTPILGGLLADKVIGQRKAVYLGAVLMAVGHFLMAVESLFFMALFFLVLGNGCFKPNISAQVGNLYQPSDSRRDRAFTIFYMGVNLGAVFSPLVCGTLGQVYGWHYGFTAAGFGMLIGLLVYAFGQKYLAEDNLTRAKESHAESVPLTKKEWRALFGFFVVCFLNIVFWGIYEQQGNTLQLFADSNVNWQVFGWTMPSTWFQLVNPIFIFAFAPLVMKLWTWQAQRKKEPSSVTKMGLGCFMLGISFLPLILVTKGLQPDQRISFLWLVGCTLIYTIAELYLSPVGLSLVTKIAPAKLVGTLMGVWFLSIAMGNYAAGYLGTFYEKMPKDSFFMLLAGFGIVAGLAFLALIEPLKNAVGADT